MTREIEAAPAALPPHPHALMAIQRALPGWSMTDLAAAASPALGRLTRHVTDCSRCRRQGMNGPLCPRAIALTADADRARNRRRGARPRPRHEMANPASRRRAPGRRPGGPR